MARAAPFTGAEWPLESLNRLNQIVGQLSGSCDSGGMGTLLPLVSAAAAVEPLAYPWRRTRRTA